MSVESLYYVKRGLHDFIDRAMQPGDLVALVRTGGSLDGLQPFTTDLRVLHAAVDNLKWNTFSRSGVESFDAVNLFGILTPDVPTGPGGESASIGAGVGDFSSLNTIRNSIMAAGTLGALNLVIEGARNFPGRKAILFVSEGFQLLDKGGGDSTAQPGRVRAALDRAVDRATRAGVVIYSIDARGLQTGAMGAADDFNCGARCPDDSTSSRRRGTRRRSAAGCGATRRKEWPISPSRPAASPCSTPTISAPACRARRRTSATTMSSATRPRKTPSPAKAIRRPTTS